MPRLSKDTWSAIRIEWEGEPNASFMALAEKHGVAVSSISRRAEREGWSKRQQLVAINEAASRRADAGVDANGNAKQRQRQSTAADLATREESEVVRSAVLIRHRTEWGELEGFRKTALKAMKDAHDMGDRVSWTIAKLAADTARTNLQALEIKQHGEARAWGLDNSDVQPTIVIERSFG